MDEKEVIKALNGTGFPFEVRVRNKLRSLGLTTTQSRYYSFEKGVEVSRDLDSLGILSRKTVNTPKKELFINNILRLVGEVKSDPDCDTICFYEIQESSDNLMLTYPNFLNHCYKLSTFLGGHIPFSDFQEKFGVVNCSKSICEFTQNHKSKGNSLLYGVSSGLAQACEYLHRQNVRSHLAGQLAFSIHSCLPFCVTNSKIFQVVVDENGGSVSVKPKTYFIYLSTYRDLDAIPLTAKEHMYFPILVTNFDGLDSAVKLFNKISDELNTDIIKLAERVDLAQQEYADYCTLRNQYDEFLHKIQQPKMKELWGSREDDAWENV